MIDDSLGSFLKYGQSHTVGNIRGHLPPACCLLFARAGTGRSETCSQIFFGIPAFRWLSSGNIWQSPVMPTELKPAMCYGTCTSGAFPGLG